MFNHIAKCNEILLYHYYKTHKRNAIGIIKTVKETLLSTVTTDFIKLSHTDCQFNNFSYMQKSEPNLALPNIITLMFVSY